MDIPPDRIEQFNQNVLYQTLGIKLSRVADGRAESILTPLPQVCWPFPNQPHGASCTTIDLTIQYLAPAQEGPFTCRAETTHQTRRLAFVRADIWDVRNRLIASGQGTFRIIKMNLM